MSPALFQLDYQSVKHEAIMKAALVFTVHQASDISTYWQYLWIIFQLHGSIDFICVFYTLTIQLKIQELHKNLEAAQQREIQLKNQQLIAHQQRIPQPQMQQVQQRHPSLQLQQQQVLLVMPATQVGYGKLLGGITV